MKSFRTVLVIIAVLSFSAAILLSQDPEPADQAVSIQVTPYQEDDQLSVDKKPSQAVRVHYFVKVGDTLSTIFSSWDLSYQSLQRLLEADLDSLKLDTIKPGDHLELVINGDDHELQELIYHESLLERASYLREDDGSYSYTFAEEQGVWQEKLYSGTIQGSFSNSAHNVGLNVRQIANITRVLRDKVDFSRDLRAGDDFDILVDEQYLGNHLTGKTEIKGITIHLQGREVAAFLAQDGRFYDREGNSLERAFNRYPVAKDYRRVTSPFNPQRKHPVTGRVTPHNGTDFATPVGTPVYSTGDGKVIAVRNHPYAGKYLVIEHNNVYKTRYLHLQTFLVKRGERVKRGQKIALSGATGRLTGPHLHFEVLVRNRAVDPIKANLPLATSISQQGMPDFIARVSKFDQHVLENKA
ncbi:peptidoglycan DD-metalloendopeptidase family protein [Vibrio hangzhouensis]|uniref:peptidoglycan DD-metalloendopeptidase family protein n=1 Tax=Vibrio hangzhouensis TaxID=462991 RepID=UPI001C956DA2|nr:peptidoglycan DD-metalloendopeptidase family protein [Vibrio hangzhouensis]MBY6196299.1 peptidoglycan DD-metalloendopeptidase family protein [Vibrio hangzhouensis]